MEHESDGNTSRNRCTWNNFQNFHKGAKRLKNQKKNWNHPNYSIFKIGQNTEKSPVDLFAYWPWTESSCSNCVNRKTARGGYKHLTLVDWRKRITWVDNRWNRRRCEIIYTGTHTVKSCLTHALTRGPEIAWWVPRECPEGGGHCLPAEK